MLGGVVRTSRCPLSCRCQLTSGCHNLYEPSSLPGRPTWPAAHPEKAAPVRQGPRHLPPLHHQVLVHRHLGGDRRHGLDGHHRQVVREEDAFAREKTEEKAKVTIFWIILRNNQEHSQKYSGSFSHIFLPGRSTTREVRVRLLGEKRCMCIPPR